jgi:hypothetical protein
MAFDGQNRFSGLFNLSIGNGVNITSFLSYYERALYVTSPEINKAIVQQPLPIEKLKYDFVSRNPISPEAQDLLYPHFLSICDSLRAILPMINCDNVICMEYSDVYVIQYTHLNIPYRLHYHRVGYDSEAPSRSVGRCSIRFHSFYIVEK